jgi:uncharacterized protein (DUF1501 family)
MKSEGAQSMRLARRTFLTKGAALLLGSSQLFRVHATDLRSADPFARRKVVLVHLAGGNDGINTVIPYSSSGYYQSRPNLAIPPEQVLALNQAVGLHPSMSALSDLYRQNKLAIVLGVGYPNASYSHFRSTEIWQTAEPEKVLSTCWFARYANVSHSTNIGQELLAKAINVDPALPKSMANADMRASYWADGAWHHPAFNRNQAKPVTDAQHRSKRQQHHETFNRLYASFEVERPSPRLLEDVGVQTRHMPNFREAAARNYRNNAQYPANGFGRGFQFVAQMITTDSETRIYNISLGGFDMHANQLPVHAKLLEQLSDSISAFQRDLEFHGVDKEVLLFVFSEFGRRLRENDQQGTDHGNAQPIFLIGSAVQGGIYGDYPSLNISAALDLKYSCDFRSIYATLLERWLDADSRSVLGKSYDILPMLV